MVFDFFTAKQKKFKPSRLRESTDPIPNPSRGWYQIFPFRLPQQPDFQELYWCLCRDEPLAMAVIHIGAYQNRPLDAAALQTVEQILEFFRQNEKDLILRFTYDMEGNGLLHEPSVFSRIEEHILQLSPLIRAYSQTVFILQGLFVGSWGEMHGSKFLAPMHLTRLYELAREAAGADTWLAVRKPSQWRILHSPNEKAVGMGLFDDGIFGSDTNLGTFGNAKRIQSSWDDPWCPEDELDFMDTLCRSAPMGGEVVCPGQPGRLSGSDILQLLKRMHVSYLNRAHDMRLLEIWKQTKSPWPGTSLYDYIGAHLGYRFFVRSASVHKKDRQNRLRITVENTGFAPCYEKSSVTLELETAGGTLPLETPWDLRSLMPGTSETLECELPEEPGNLYISVLRDKDGRALHFANEGTAGERLLLGQLL